jgi:hypothetical protein
MFHNMDVLQVVLRRLLMSVELFTKLWFMAVSLTYNLVLLATLLVFSSFPTLSEEGQQFYVF